MVFITIAATGILSGSRSSFLIFIFTFFGYKYFYNGILPEVKKIFKYVPIILGGALTVILITDSGNLQTSFIILAYRFIANGDIYWMSLPNSVINNIHIENVFTFLFSGILGPLRLIDYSIFPPPIGAQLNWIISPILDGIMAGPNSRPPILGYVLFGWMGLMFTFILGLFVSIFLFQIPKIFPKGFISSAFILFFYINVISFITDPTLGITYVFDIVLNLLLLLFMIIILSLLLMKKNNGRIWNQEKCDA